MYNKRTNVFLILAGILFLLSLIVDTAYLITNFKDEFTIGKLLYGSRCICFLIIAIGLFLNNSKVIKIGIILLFPYFVEYFVTMITKYRGGVGPFVFKAFADIIALIFLFLSVKSNNHNSLIYGILACIVTPITCVFVELTLDRGMLKYLYFQPFEMLYKRFWIFTVAVKIHYLSQIIGSIFLPLSYLLVGIGFSKNTKTDISRKAPDNVVDRLEQLKELHDKGILTTEEFDQKKKKLLGD